MLTIARRLRRRDEAGSLIVALMVMVVLSGLAIAVTARALTTNHANRQDQDYSAGLAAADSGVSDALFQLDNNTTGSTSGVCTGQSTLCFFNSGGVGGNTWSYVATQASAGNWTLRSRGYSNGREHDAVATLTASSVFGDYGVFATTSLDFSGASCGAGDLGVPIGASGSISYPCGSRNDCFDPGGGGPPGCTHINKKHLVPVPGTAGGPQFPSTVNCPSTLANLGGSVTSLPAGTYYCNGAGTGVSISGSFSVTGPVKIYVGGSATFSMSRGSYSVNWPAAPDTAQCDATQFQVYSAVSSTIDFNGKAPSLCGAFYTPLATYTLPGDQLTLKGSIVASSVIFKGTLKGQFVDAGLANLTLGNWTVQGYHETGSTCTSSC